ASNRELNATLRVSSHRHRKFVEMDMARQVGVLAGTLQVEALRHQPPCENAEQEQYPRIASTAQGHFTGPRQENDIDNDSHSCKHALMYVCICNAVTERTIRELVADGYHSLNEIQALTGCSGTC